MPHATVTQSPTQRRITLLRHAQAMPDREDDHARPLAPEGRDAALALGAWLQENDFLPELVLCSTAVRTRETLAALRAILPTELHAALYLASTGEMLRLLQQADNGVGHVMLLGHNPGIHSLAAFLARDFVRDADADAIAQHFPPCGLVSMTLALSDWSQLQPQSAVVDVVRFDSRD